VSDCNAFFRYNTYNTPKAEKEGLLVARLKQLTNFHYDHCEKYRNMIGSLGYKPNQTIDKIGQIPFVPISLFKHHDLKSIKYEEVYRTLYSSGTSASGLSKIYLDRDTASLQQKVLVRSVHSFTGINRFPMLIIDTQAHPVNQGEHRARTVAILGFSLFSSDRCFALDENLHLRTEAIRDFLHKHKGKTILIFGFTFNIWKYFVNEIKDNSLKFDLNNSILIHGGGWKKLIDRQISNKTFKEALFNFCGIDRVINYYGMIEQTGSLYFECQLGNLHTSIFNDIIIRRHLDFSPAPTGEPGMIQTLSAIPQSYCGHSLLTADKGVILGEDDCPCGRKGKYFHVLGRFEQTEIRGCSDTYEA